MVKTFVNIGPPPGNPQTEKQFLEFKADIHLLLISVSHGQLVCICIAKSV